MDWPWALAMHSLRNIIAYDGEMQHVCPWARVAVDSVEQRSLGGGG